MAKVNFTEDDVNRGKVVEEAGWHAAKIENHKEEPDTKEGAPLYKYRARILDGKYKGMVLYFQFSAKAMGFAIPLAKATGAAVGPKGLAGWDTESVVGKTVEFYVKPGMYNGKAQNDVQDYRPVGAGRVSTTV